ncbi:sensor histidine kinase [Paralimibaculum aggregatum]|uniref:sensor histidine kinase n=1 Tax=Paralimibaculum aggregatum TaxID=3036245 RepID=UPI0025532A1A|nr:PAS domain-containing sensor histidine kinase [Limibaculum sp. NKW23]
MGSAESSVILALTGLSVLALVLGVLVLRRAAGGRQREHGVEGAAPVLVLEGDRIVACSGAAREIGAAAGMEATAFLAQHFAAAEAEPAAAPPGAAPTGPAQTHPVQTGPAQTGAAPPGAASAALEALRQTQRTGQEHRSLLARASGEAVEMHVYPRGGQIAIELHSVAPAAETPARPDAAGTAPMADQPAAAAMAGTPGPQPHRSEPVDTLLESGSLILWRTGPGGETQWASGCIRYPEGTVNAAQALELLAARRLTLETESPGKPRAQGHRLEVVHGTGVLPLSVVELDIPGGGHVGYAVDASAAASAERTLTRFVQTMTETFAHLTVGLAIFDRNQTLVLFNPALVRMWEQDPAWLARRPGLREILDRLRSARRVPDVRDYHAWRDELLGLFNDTERAEYEELWNLADGTSIRVLARPHPHGALAFVFDDATERMRLERRNRHMDDLINSTLENLHEGLAVFAPDGTLKFVNRAFHEIWDTDSSSVTLDMHASDLCALCSRLTVETEVWERMVTFATGEDNRRAWTARLSLGSGRMLGARFAPLPDGSTMALFADVTDSERIAAALSERNEALEAAEQIRSAVLDQISHRLRTPLNTIFGFGELLTNPRLGELTDQQGHYVSGILEAAAQLLDTISAITELASLQIDPLEGEDGGFGVEEVLTSTAGLLEKRAAAGQVGLNVQLDGAIGVLSCNPVRLRQIVFNLTADAIHRCPELGEVTLHGRREDSGTVEISTRETAEPALLAELPSTNRIEINSLTLSLVRRLVAQEGGALEIKPDVERGHIRITCRFPETVETLPLALDAG